LESDSLEDRNYWYGTMVLNWILAGFNGLWPILL